MSLPFKKTNLRHLNGRHARGASLIEILIAVFVLTIGILGMAAMQARAIKGNLSSMQRTQAVMLSYYILDVMRVDKDTAKTLGYNTGSLDTATGLIGPACVPASYSGTTLVQNNMRHWVQSIKNNVGTAGDNTSCGAVLCDSDGVCRVQVRWDDSRAGGLGVQFVETSSRL